MKNLKDLSFSDLKSIYDTLETSKSITKENYKYFKKDDVHSLINKQKIIWLEMNERIYQINELNRD